MREDKRVKRTRRSLRLALMALVAQQPFEQITVKAICDRAEISRITFYTHYSDKYDLAEDIFTELITDGTAEYQQLQRTNNPERDPILGYSNILDCIFNLYELHPDFFQSLRSNENPYLTTAFFSHAMAIMEQHTNHASSVLSPKFPLHSIMAFLCFGLGGFISEGGLTLAEGREGAKQILLGILASDVLIQRLPSPPLP